MLIPDLRQPHPRKKKKILIIESDLYYTEKYKEFLRNKYDVFCLNEEMRKLEKDHLKSEIFKIIRSYKIDLIIVNLNLHVDIKNIIEYMKKSFSKLKVIGLIDQFKEFEKEDFPNNYLRRHEIMDNSKILTKKVKEVLN